MLAELHTQLKFPCVVQSPLSAIRDQKGCHIIYIFFLALRLLMAINICQTLFGFGYLNFELLEYYLRTLVICFMEGPFVAFVWCFSHG